MTRRPRRAAIWHVRIVADGAVGQLSIAANAELNVNIRPTETQFLMESAEKVANRITTGNGVTIAAPTPQKNEMLRPDVAYVMTSFMKDVVNRGTGAPIRARGFKYNVAGKTGTSRDGWFVGFTPNLVCAVWVGFDDGSQLGLTGAASALPESRASEGL